MVDQSGYRAERRAFIGAALGAVGAIVGLLLVSLQSELFWHLGLVAREAATVAEAIDHEVPQPQVGVGGSENFRTKLTVAHPNQVVVGDAVPITIEVSQLVVRRPGIAAVEKTAVINDSPPPPEEAQAVLAHDLEIELSSGSLDWGNTDGKRHLDARTPLPVKLAMAPGAKDTGRSVVVLRMRDMVDQAKILAGEPQVYVELNGVMLEPGENDEIPFVIVVLSKYHLDDFWVHWLGVAGWFVTAIGVGCLVKFGKPVLGFVIRLFRRLSGATP